MSLTHKATTATKIVQQVGGDIDAGSGVGQLLIYTGTPPGARNAASGTLLCTINLQKPSFSYANGVATLLGVPLSGTVSNASTAQTPGYFRLCDSAGNVIEEGACSEGGSLELNLPAGTTVVNGNTIAVGGYTITVN